MSDPRSDRFVRSHLKTRHLVLLVELGRHRSILHAAQAANLTQPAASKLLGEIEHALNVQLFERLPRGVRLLPAGATLLPRARAILADVAGAARAARRAGASPTAMPIRVAAASEKPNTVPSSRMAPARGSPGGLNAMSAPTPLCAMSNPNIAPSAASSRLSVRSWRASRARRAPSAARTANSPPRCAPRASSRFVTFTHAITISSSTAPSTASSAGRDSRVTSAWSVFTRKPCPIVAHAGRGNSAIGFRAIDASSARIASNFAPGRMRATIARW